MSFKEEFSFIHHPNNVCFLFQASCELQQTIETFLLVVC